MASLQDTPSSKHLNDSEEIKNRSDAATRIQDKGTRESTLLGVCPPSHQPEQDKELHKECEFQEGTNTGETEVNYIINNKYSLPSEM